MASNVDASKIKHLLVYADTKSGQVDDGKEREQQLSILASGGSDSAYMQHALKLDGQSDQRIEKLLARKANMTSTDYAKACSITTAAKAKAEQSRSFARHIVVLDYDAFYANVEIRDQPYLKDKPVVVGRGIICTSNYIARKYGVRSGMPTYKALQCCPHLISLPMNFDKYKEAADALRKIVSEHDANYISSSLDEIIFDVTNSARRRCESQGQDPENVAIVRQHAEAIVHEVRQRTCEATRGLTSSAGLANNATLAKVASNINKPDGQYSVAPSMQDVLYFLRDLNLRKMPGIGRVFEKTMNSLGLTTMGQVLQELPMLSHVFQRTSSSFLLYTSLGISLNEGVERKKDVLPSSAVQRKSISVERTFSTLFLPSEIRNKLSDIADKLSKGMKERKLWGKAITLKLKTAKFDVTTRSHTLAVDIQSREDLFKHAMELLEPQMSAIKGPGIRLMGLSVSHFRNAVSKQAAELANKCKSIDAFLTTKSKKAQNNENGKAKAPPATRGVKLQYSGHGLDTGTDEDGEVEEEGGREEQPFDPSPHSPYTLYPFEDSSQRSEDAQEDENGEVDFDEEEEDNYGFSDRASMHAHETDVYDDGGYDIVKEEGEPPIKKKCYHEEEVVFVPQKIQCPVCQRELDTTDVGKASVHVDRCLLRKQKKRGPLDRFLA